LAFIGEQYFEKWFYGDLQNGDYFEHVASWWAVRSNPNILILRYEDLASDTPSTIRRIASFIGIALDETRLAEILDATSLRSMRKWNEGWLDWFLIKMGVMKGDHIRLERTRRNQVSFTDTQRTRMVKKYQTLLEPLWLPPEYVFAHRHSL